jgi:hypothetical protein
MERAMAATSSGAGRNEWLPVTRAATDLDSTFSTSSPSAASTKKTGKKSAIAVSSNRMNRLFKSECSGYGSTQADNVQFDDIPDMTHEPVSLRGLKKPSLEAVYKRSKVEESERPSADPLPAVDHPSVEADHPSVEAADYGTMTIARRLRALDRERRGDPLPVVVYIYQGSELIRDFSGLRG